MRWKQVPSLQARGAQAGEMTGLQMAREKE
jgi:hypothetical protein